MMRKVLLGMCVLFLIAGSAYGQENKKGTFEYEVQSGAFTKSEKRQITLEYLLDGSLQAPSREKKILGILYLDKKRDIISPENIKKMLLFMQKYEDGTLDFKYERLSRSSSRISDQDVQSKKTCVGGVIHIETQVSLLDTGTGKYTYNTKLQKRIGEEGTSKLLEFEYSNTDGNKWKLTPLY